MKIGIVTQPLSRNYGGILQNYALQQTLKKLGHESYTFDLGKYTWLDYAIQLSKTLVKKIIGRECKFPILPHKRRRIEEPLRNFVKERISLAEPRSNRLTQSIAYRYKLNAIVVGSDQVWRPKYNYDITDMYLNFMRNEDIKRIAYAASFGTGTWEYTPEQTESCKMLVKKFDAISVREDSAINLCNEYLHVKATHVLDPTMLLTKDDYNSLLNEYKSISKPFLFAYILDSNTQKIEYVKQTAKLMGLEVVIKGADKDVRFNDSIEKWLSCFRDANYVITDSFHGTAFSIVYNKDFQVIGNVGRGLDRMTSLLKLFSLTDHLIDTSSVFPQSLPKIDWQSVNATLEEKRAYSTDYLINALK